MLNQEDILKSFNTPQGHIIFYWDKGISRIKVFLKIKEESIEISSRIHSKIPDEIIQNRQKISFLLSKINMHDLKLSKTENNEYQWEIVPGLKGGGNIGVGINTWPLSEPNNGTQRRFIIPYTMGSPKMKALHETITALKQTGLKVLPNHNPTLGEEIQAIHATNEAIKLWNDTGLIELLPLEECRKKYPNVSTERWIEFHTNNDESICQAACIGMCRETGPLHITCDLDRVFRRDPARSMMHEIGHMIGLRHEHARLDRGSYVNTTLTEGNRDPAHMETIGHYDRFSIMHYDFGKYGKKCPIKYIEAKTPSSNLCSQIDRRELIVVIKDIEKKQWLIIFKSKNDNSICQMSVHFNGTHELSDDMVYSEVEQHNGYITCNEYLYLLQHNQELENNANKYRAITLGDQDSVKALISRAIDRETKARQELKIQADKEARHLAIMQLLTQEDEEAELPMALLRIRDSEVQPNRLSSSSFTGYPTNSQGYFPGLNMNHPNLGMPTLPDPSIGIGNNHRNSQWAASSQHPSTPTSSSSINNPMAHRDPVGFHPMTNTHHRLSFPTPISSTSSTIPDDYDDYKESVPIQSSSSSRDKLF